MVYSCCLHSSFLRDSMYSSSTSWLESLLTRLFFTIMYNSECISFADATCFSAMGWNPWGTFSDGLPLVQRRCCKSNGCIYIRLLCLPSIMDGIG